MYIYAWVVWLIHICDATRTAALFITVSTQQRHSMSSPLTHSSSSEYTPFLPQYFTFWTIYSVSQSHALTFENARAHFWEKGRTHLRQLCDWNPCTCRESLLASYALTPKTKGVSRLRAHQLDASSLKPSTHSVGKRVCEGIHVRNRPFDTIPKGARG